MKLEVDKKAKFGKGASHLLQTSTIQQVLGDLDIMVYLHYSPYFRPKIDYQLLLNSSFSPTSRPEVSSGYISMYVYGVKSKEKEALEGVTLPKTRTV